jgi:hypothetical protein
MVLQNKIDDKLLEFYTNTKRIKWKINNTLHKLVVEALALNQLDIRKSFDKLATGKDLTKEPDINAVKDVSMIKIDYMTVMMHLIQKSKKNQLIDFFS